MCIHLPTVEKWGWNSRQIKRALHLPPVQKIRLEVKADQEGLALTSCSKNQAGSQGRSRRPCTYQLFKKSGWKSRQIKRALHLPAVQKIRLEVKADQEGLALTVCSKNQAGSQGRSTYWRCHSVLINQCSTKLFCSHQTHTTLKCGKYPNTISIKCAQFPSFVSKISPPFTAILFIVLGIMLIS